MTEVEAYSDVYGVIKFDGSQESKAIKFSVSIKHNILKSKRVGRMMPYKISDGCEVTGSIGRDQVNPVWLAAMLTDTPTTGAAETLKSGITVSADGATAMDDTSIASPSKVRVTVTVAAITTPGEYDIVGEDVSGEHITDTLTFTDEGVGEYQETKKLFKKVYYGYNRGIRSTGGGTLTVASVAGDSTATPSTSQKTFSLSGEYTKGSNYVRITCNNCLFDSGGLNIQEGSVARDDMTWYMRGDNDSDLIVEGVNA